MRSPRLGACKGGLTMLFAVGRPGLSSLKLGPAMLQNLISIISRLKRDMCGQSHARRRLSDENFPSNHYLMETSNTNSAAHANNPLAARGIFCPLPISGPLHYTVGTAVAGLGDGSQGGWVQVIVNIAQLRSHDPTTMSMSNTLNLMLGHPSPSRVETGMSLSVSKLPCVRPAVALTKCATGIGHGEQP